MRSVEELKAMHDGEELLETLDRLQAKVKAEYDVYIQSLMDKPLPYNISAMAKEVVIKDYIVKAIESLNGYKLIAYEFDKDDLELLCLRHDILHYIYKTWRQHGHDQWGITVENVYSTIDEAIFTLSTLL